jgi:hypothetical protein
MEIIAGYYRLSSCPNWTVLDSLYRINKSVRPVRVSFRTRTGGQKSRTRHWMEEILEFIKSVEEVFTVQAKAIKINDEVVLHEGKFQQEREGLEL